MAVNIHAGQESAESCCRQVLEWTSERVGTSPISLQFLPLKSKGPMLAFFNVDLAARRGACLHAVLGRRWAAWGRPDLLPLMIG
jgi:hypothetical protein